MGKLKNKPRISFVGTSSTSVTGSCIHIQLENKQILLECGLYQSCRSSLNDYKINSARLPFKAKDIDYIFVLHNHIDHIGKIPMLYQQGCNAQIIAPQGSEPIARLLLRDCAYINQKDAETISRRTGKVYPALFTNDEVNLCLDRWTEFPINEKIMIDENIEFRMIPSGHILNSVQIELWLKHKNTTKKLVYTSDLGNISLPKYYTEPISKVDKCNVMIAESTYGGEMSHINIRYREKDLEKIKNIINETCFDKGGKVLIPVFANDRCQNMLTYLYDIFGHDNGFNIPVLIDSPMACEITKLYADLLNGEQLEKYQNVLGWKNAVFVKDYEDSMFYRNATTPMVVLSASGMLQAGRSVGWVESLLSSSKNFILFCGYAPIDSLAGKIKSGKQKSITINRKSIPNRCNIANLKSFSSHIQRQDMLDYYSSVNCEKIALVHGEYKDKCEFARDLQDEIKKKNKTTKVISVNKNSELLL